MRSRSVEYGIDKIILTGGSAGANLALTAAYADSCEEYKMGKPYENVKVDGVIGFFRL